MGDTVEEVKDEVKQAAKKVTDSDTYLGSDDEKENRDIEAGGKDPMNPEEIAKHEPLRSREIRIREVQATRFKLSLF